MFRSHWHPWLLLSPALVLLALLTLYPIGYSLMLAFTDTQYGGPMNFVGLANFRELFSDWFFQQATRNTVAFTLAASLTQVGLGLLLALLFHQPFRGRSLILPLCIYPMMLSTLVCSSIWKAWLHYDFGWLNNLFAVLGLARVSWLSDPNTALAAIVLVDTWQWTPLAFMLLLAGLQAIPNDIEEAATLEGASAWQRFWLVRLPLLRAPLFLALLLRSIDAFKLFDKNYVLTGGGPAYSTETLSLLAYKQGFKFFNLGTASAIAVVMLIIALLLSLVYAWQVIRRPH